MHPTNANLVTAESRRRPDSCGIRRENSGKMWNGRTRRVFVCTHRLVSKGFTSHWSVVDTGEFTAQTRCRLTVLTRGRHGVRSRRGTGREWRGAGRLRRRPRGSRLRAATFARTSLSLKAADGSTSIFRSLSKLSDLCERLILFSTHLLGFFNTPTF